jgi:hypothetical protein
MTTESNRELRAAGQMAATDSPSFKALEGVGDPGLVVRVPAPGSSPPSAAGGTYRIVRNG